MQRVTEMERNRKLMPKFVLKEMESLYIEELKSSINLLMANLESLPVSKGSMDSKYGLGIKKKYNHRWVASHEYFSRQWRIGNEIMWNIAMDWKMRLGWTPGEIPRACFSLRYWDKKDLISFQSFHLSFTWKRWVHKLNPSRPDTSLSLFAESTFTLIPNQLPVPFCWVVYVLSVSHLW